MRSCPHCGASIHEGAAFCPRCAQPVGARREIQPPRYIPRRAMRIALLIFAAAAVILLLTFWSYSRPKVYDNGTAGAVYTSQGVDYRLCIAWADSPFTPAGQRYTSCPLNGIYRYPVLLFVSLADSETLATDTFLEQVERITAEVANVEDGLQMTCAQPVRDTDYIPDAAAIVRVSPLAAAPGQHSAEIIISVQMKNGDVIRLRQLEIVSATITWDYTPDDVPMDTVRDLQALMAQIAETVGPDDEVNIYLPPVTYTEEFVFGLDGGPVNLIGSADEAGNRTAFANTVQVTRESGWLLILGDIDFVGPGAGTGLSISARVHLERCRVAGWETGVLAHTDAWVNLDECVFEDNAVGFCFDAESGNPSDTQYNGNTFRNNGTAILLEQVPNDVSLKFDGSRFQNNGQDIDNRCGHALELEDAVFE